MQKTAGYDDSQAFTGEFETLSPGGYICIIRQAVVDKTENGKERLNLLFDIAEGDSKGYYKRKYDDAVKFNSDAKWQGVYRQLTEGKSTPFFKGLMTSIEVSNAGFKWNWDEKALAGKLFGGMFGREQYKNGAGDLRWSTKCQAIRSVDTIRKGVEAPADRYLEENTSGGYAAGSNNDFSTVSGDDDLPF